jgi:hypothetical protein
MASSMFRGTCSKDTFHIKTFVASDMLWAKIKFAMEYLDFLSSVSDEFGLGVSPDYACEVNCTS